MNEKVVSSQHVRLFHNDVLYLFGNFRLCSLAENICYRVTYHLESGLDDKA